jgi:type I restriction enzyme M protein
MIGQFFTPEIVAQTMYRMVGTVPGMRVLDPSCGDGVFVKCRPEGVDMFACELDGQHGEGVRAVLPVGNFVSGDALTELSGWTGTFDLMIGNPPFSAQRHLEKRAEVLSNYEFGKGRPRQCLEVLFVELFVRLAKPGGRIAIILPDGPLGNGPFHYVRRYLLEHTQVEMILSLPRNTFASTQAKTNVLILQKHPAGNVPKPTTTWLRSCDDLSELEEMKLPDKKHANDWMAVNLAETEDWRPEAHQGDGHPTEASQIAEGWVRLGDVVDARTGSAKYGVLRELFDEPAPDRLMLMRAKNVDPAGGLRINPAEDEVAYISKSGAMFRESAVLEAGEILFVRVGAGCYGRTALIPKGLVAQADDWIHVLTPFPSVKGFDASGLVRWMNTDEGKAMIKRMAKGVGTVSISKSALMELLIPAAFAGRSKVKTQLAKQAKLEQPVQPSFQGSDDWG